MPAHATRSQSAVVTNEATAGRGTDGRVRSVAEAGSGPAVLKAAKGVLAFPRSLAPARPHGLSERELEVGHLLTHAKSDKEIASALNISPRTVQVHVAHILEKLGVPSRTGAAIWLIENGVAW